MTDEVRKPNWIEVVEKTAEFHKNQLRINPKQTLKMTAKSLSRSIGRVSEDLQLAAALTNPIYRKQLERFKYAEDALGFLKDKRKELRIM